MESKLQFFGLPVRLTTIKCTRRFFFFNDTATTEIYTLSLHDALPIYNNHHHGDHPKDKHHRQSGGYSVDRKSGSAGMPRPISYAVFCLKKKKKERWQYIELYKTTQQTEASDHTHHEK